MGCLWRILACRENGLQNAQPNWHAVFHTFVHFSHIGLGGIAASHPVTVMAHG